MRTFTPMQNAEEECGIREKRGEASWRWVPGAELSGEDGEAVSGCRIQPQRSPLLRHSAFLFCILHRGEIPYPAFISPLPTLPLKGAAFARWPLGDERRVRGDLVKSDEHG